MAGERLQGLALWEYSHDECRRLSIPVSGDGKERRKGEGDKLSTLEREKGQSQSRGRQAKEGASERFH